MAEESPEVILHAQTEGNLQFDADGRVLDYLDPGKTREATKEELVRQTYARVLHENYGYAKDHMAFEVEIPVGRDKRPRADIGVFTTAAAAKRKDITKLWFVVETKAPHLKDGKDQLTSYVFASSAAGGVWTDGDAIAYFYHDVKKRVLTPWTGIPRAGETWDAVGNYRKGDLKVPHNLKSVFRRCHNAMYRTGVDSEDVALDMVRILLAKFKDEEREGDDCLFRCSPQEYDTDEGRRIVADRVRALFEEVKRDHPEVFGPADEISVQNDTAICNVVQELQPYALLQSSYDVLGTAYETYVASHLRGERGQYFTNRLVINLMVGIVSPTEDDIILDPACGSAGFLISTFNHVLARIESSNRSKQAKERLKAKIRSRLFGVDKTPKLVRVAKTNMILGGDGHTGITHGDSLDDLGKLDDPTFPGRCGFGAPTVVLTNPPFGASAEHRIKDPSILQHFDVGHVWHLDEEEGKWEQTQVVNDSEGVHPEVLFLERCVEWAKPGGHVGIVMARGMLDNKRAAPVRQWLLRHAKLLAVINLHEDTFEPFTGAKASLLIFQKKARPSLDRADYPVFMAISKKIGHTSRGEPIFKKNAEGDYVLKDGARLLDHDLDDILQAYEDFKRGKLKESNFLYAVGRKQLEAPQFNLNPVRFLPQFANSVQRVVEAGDRDGWSLVRLGDICTPFNGPRFKRPYADEGVTEGPDIYPYFTGTALTQSHGQNVKYLDKSKANEQNKKHIEKLIVERDWIMITDSGTLGRIVYTTDRHHGVVVTNNMIRIVLEDEELRGYIYQFLMSEFGQHQLLKTGYGTNQDHLEPEHVSEIMIPFPPEKEWRKIGKAAIESIRAKERSDALLDQASTNFLTAMATTKERAD